MTHAVSTKAKQTTRHPSATKINLLSLNRLILTNIRALTAASRPCWDEWVLQVWESHKRRTGSHQFSSCFPMGLRPFPPTWLFPIPTGFCERSTLGFNWKKKWCCFNQQQPNNKAYSMESYSSTTQVSGVFLFALLSQFTSVVGIWKTKLRNHNVGVL